MQQLVARDQARQLSDPRAARCLRTACTAAACGRPPNLRAGTAAKHTSRKSSAADNKRHELGSRPAYCRLLCTSGPLMHSSAAMARPSTNTAPAQSRCPCCGAYGALWLTCKHRYDSAGSPRGKEAHCHQATTPNAENERGALNITLRC